MSVDTASHFYVAHLHCMQHAENPPLLQPVPGAHILTHRILKIEGNTWYEVGLPHLSTSILSLSKIFPSGMFALALGDMVALVTTFIGASCTFSRVVFGLFGLLGLFSLAQFQCRTLLVVAPKHTAMEQAPPSQLPVEGGGGQVP